jgi:DNA (cytosine-5)-methyltransferase 1
MIAQPTAGTLGTRGLRSHTELDGHGAYIPVAPVPYDLFQITAPVNRQNRVPGDPCHTLAKDNAAHAAVAQSMTVRRLTPRECERLQGFPDDWTMIPYRGKSPENCPDGPRSKALGNSMACNCMSWIGERIAAYEAQNGST